MAVPVLDAFLACLFVVGRFEFFVAGAKGSRRCKEPALKRSLSHKGQKVTRHVSVLRNSRSSVARFLSPSVGPSFSAPFSASVFARPREPKKDLRLTMALRLETDYGVSLSFKLTIRVPHISRNRFRFKSWS